MNKQTGPAAIQLKPLGDHELTSRYGGTEVKLDKKEYKLLGSEEILGILS